jgi:hypothetical protein
MVEAIHVCLCSSLNTTCWSVVSFGMRNLTEICRGSLNVRSYCLIRIYIYHKDINVIILFLNIHKLNYFCIENKEKKTSIKKIKENEINGSSRTKINIFLENFRNVV